MSKTFSEGRAPQIIIEKVEGDLSLVGWEGEDILVKGDDDAMQCVHGNGSLNISCADDLSLRAPKGAAVSINQIEGDAAMRGILGGVILQAITGDLSIRDAGAISVQSAEGDVSIRSVSGETILLHVEGDIAIRDAESVSIDAAQDDVSIERVKNNVIIQSAGADVSIRDVSGDVTLNATADDLALRDVRGSVIANVGEDVVLYLDPQPGRSYNIHAGDDILLVMPPSANATLNLNGDSIDVEWRGVERDAESSARVVKLGNGEPAMTLSAGGDIRVTNQSNAGDSAEDFGNFAGVGMDWSGFGERISRQVEQAARRASKRAEEAAQKASKRGAFLKVGRWNWDVTQRGVPMPPQPQASDEERLAILKMLQEKKISAEDAEKLLAALEGEA
ncbi:MAG: hypothetical protein Fur002_10260 [Anaerolineales bacterium]